mmetsp:Transcript_51508/g.125612  ORF Transcript_51508/g.125612 Transcript_51508/m.125612 type:complete len:336 (+) Transcript_51508:49-1056(+)
MMSSTSTATLHSTKPQHRHSKKCNASATQGAIVQTSLRKMDRATGLAEGADGLEVREGLPEALHGRLLRGAEPDAGVVELLVGLVLAVGIADLALQVVVVLGLELPDPVPRSPLDVGVDVHLDDPVGEGELDLVLLRPRAAVEHEVDGLLLLALELLLDVLLGVAEDVGPELHVANLVHAVAVAEGSRDGEDSVGHRREGLVNLPDLVGLRVHAGVVHALVVDAILLATGDAELHLEQAVDLGHALEVLDADLDVLVEGLLGEIEHVGAEEGLAVLLEILLVGLEHAIEPRQELLGAVVRVQHHGHPVGFSNLADIVGAGDGAEDAGVEGLLGVG